jgi:N-carbamoyl-L-amino-acid hydrolase
MSLGIVTAIYGNLRHRRVVCRGEAAHAGTTPRGLRHDAVVAIADFIMRVDREWSRWLEQGKQLVVTHGILGTNAQEHAISRVPGEATMSLELRADDATTLEAFHSFIQAEASAVGRERGVAFDFDAPITNRPAQMDPEWRDRLERLCDEERLPHVRLPSGAGHDAAVFAQVGIPTAMLFIRNQFGSHNPDERMELTDFVAATRVLTRALLATA